VQLVNVELPGDDEYRPAAHGVQLLALEEYSPAAQGVQVLLEPREYFPAAQDVQVLLVLKEYRPHKLCNYCSLLEYLPAGHDEHEGTSPEVEYLPVAQILQPPDDKYCPATQQAVCAYVPVHEHRSPFVQ
jgi:hypothetical protein